MASQTAGIQQLLAAEKKAAEKINEARKRKAKRLKQANDEAKAEIEKCRQVSRNFIIPYGNLTCSKFASERVKNFSA